MKADSTRRSGRYRVPSKKYSNDAFETLNTLLSSDSDDEAAVHQVTSDPKDDFDFPGLQVPQEGDALDGDNSDASNLSDGSAVPTPDHVEEDSRPYRTSGRKLPAEQSSTRVSSIPKSRQHARPQPSETRSKGLVSNVKSEDYQSRIQLLAGPGEKEILQIARSRDQWANELTLPRKDRFRHPFSHTDDKRAMEATAGWDWYTEQGGKEIFAKKQKVQVLTTATASKSLPFLKRDSQRILLGPYNQQRFYSLPPSHCLNINTARINTSAAAGANPLAGGLSPRNPGWMLNIGARIRCLDWASNHEGDNQYLALAVCAHDVTPFAKAPARGAPAFTPSSPSISCIQIWSFPSPVGDQTVDSGGTESLPALRQVLCTEWGQIKQLKWCPMPRAPERAGEAEQISIGLLAGVWSDGFARVLDVQLDGKNTQGVQYLQCSAAAFAVCPTNTISTCLAWLSATDLAIGHANGQLAVYDICPEARPTADPSTEMDSVPVSVPNNGPDSQFDAAESHTDETEQISQGTMPWLSHSLHPTLILSLASAYPTHPALLVSSSLSGHTRLTSLQNPAMDFTFSRRSNTPAMVLVYYDPLMGVVGPDEGGELLRLHGLRTWSSGISFAKLHGVGGTGAGCLDVGKVHSSVVWGGSDGRVAVTNPIRRILNKRDHAYQQTVFKHEWVQEHLDNASNTPERILDVNGARRGIVRITEGYKVERSELELRAKVVGKKGNSNTATIHEEETGATAVCWNPNLKVGGWLAVGWGSGLVRVEDVGI